MMTRGSKMAAEKVDRGSDSGPEMGSPARREPIPPVTNMQVCAIFSPTLVNRLPL